MDEERKNPVQLWVARLAFPSFLILLTASFVIFAPQLWTFFSDSYQVRVWVQGWGIGAPVVFICLQFLQVVIFVIPGEFIQIAGGYLFGFIGGTTYSIVGIALGSIFAFFLSRILGVRFVHSVAGKENIKKFDHFMGSAKIVSTFFLLFLIPGFPKDILCYVAGLSRMRFPAFFVISTVARIPGILGSSLMGKAFAENNWLLLSLVIFSVALLFFLGWLFNKPILTLVEKYAVDQNPLK